MYMYNTLGKQMGGWLRWVCFIRYKFFHVDFHLTLDNLLNISEYVQLAKKNLDVAHFVAIGTRRMLFTKN